MTEEENAIAVVRSCLSQPSHFLYRPVPKHGFAVDVAGIDRSEITAVIREAAMVAQHKIRVRRYDHFGIRPAVLVGPGNIIFDQELLVYVHSPFDNPHMITRNPDYSLNKALLRVARIPKHYDVAPLDWLDPGDKLIDENAFLIVER